MEHEESSVSSVNRSDVRRALLVLLLEPSNKWGKAMIKQYYIQQAYLRAAKLHEHYARKQYWNWERLVAQDKILRREEVIESFRYELEDWPTTP